MIIKSIIIFMQLKILVLDFCVLGITQQDKIINIHRNHSYNFGEKRKKKKEWDSALTHRTGHQGIG